jgi:hypothetical protein
MSRTRGGTDPPSDFLAAAAADAVELTGAVVPAPDAADLGTDGEGFGAVGCATSTAGTCRANARGSGFDAASAPTEETTDAAAAEMLAS